MGDMLRCNKCSTFHYRNDPCPDDEPSETLESWLDEWEAAVESGQSSISRDEAVRRWSRKFSMD